MTIRVVIADDERLVRTGFRLILGSEPDLEVVGEATTGHEAVAITRELHPDVVLMDIRMPDLDGIEATRRIVGDPGEPGCRVRILTTFDLDEYVFAALRAGASGFVLKDAPADQLVGRRADGGRRRGPACSQRHPPTDRGIRPRRPQVRPLRGLTT